MWIIKCLLQNDIYLLPDLSTIIQHKNVNKNSKFFKSTYLLIKLQINMCCKLINCYLQQLSSLIKLWILYYLYILYRSCSVVGHKTIKYKNTIRWSKHENQCNNNTFAGTNVYAVLASRTSDLPCRYVIKCASKLTRF